MTRQIKFRAWTTKQYGNQGDSFYSPANSMISPQEVYDDLNKWINNEDESIHLMQFTALLDKNGKEIYEGDVINDLDNNCVSVIEWERAGFMQRIKKAYEKLNGKDYRKPEYEDGITGLADGRGLEIIGDIYSNPDLLTS